MKVLPQLLAVAAVAIATGCTTVLPTASYPVRAKADSLRVSVSAQNAKGEGDVLTTAVAASVRKALVERHFRVEESETADVAVSLDVSHREVNRASNFILLEGSVAARAVVPARDNRVIGEEIIKSRGTRALGESEAMDALAEALVPKVSDWARRSLSVEATGVRAQTIVISYAHANTKDLPRFKVEFVQAVLATPGVRSCALVSESDTPPSAEYRVVYDEGAFPAGIVNEIAVSRPELHLRPGAAF